MARPTECSDIPEDDRAHRIGAVFYNFDALAAHPGVIQSAGEFLDACRAQGLDVQQNNSGGIEIRVPRDPEELWRKLERLQRRWDDGKTIYDRGVTHRERTSVELRYYCTREGLDVPEVQPVGMAAEDVDA